MESAADAASLTADALGVPLNWLYASILFGLRVAPVFALAPPFSLIGMPPLFRALAGLGLAACIVSAHPAAAQLADTSLAVIVPIALRELLLGMVFVLAFQLMYAGLYVAGRTIDIQAGFGLAVLIDPTTRGQNPLIGSLFVYTAALVFLGMNGHGELLRILGATLDAIPLGQGALPGSLEPLTAFLSAVFLISFGIAGGAILCLFLADVAIAAMARTMPQMNVLILGIQVKTVLTLTTLPLTFGVAAGLFARLARVTLEALPRLVATT